MNDSDFEYIRKFIRDQAAIILDPGKEYLVESRLSPLAKQEGFSSLEDFIQSLRSQPANGHHLKVIDAMTTNETLFFRDIHPFETLKKDILPTLIAKRAAEKKMNIWCAAASSGQEPYTIAMILKENFPVLADWSINFVASDISDSMLERARSGVYNQLEANRGLPAIYLAKYFEKNGGDWRIKELLRKMVDFRKVNLMQAWPVFPPYDLIFMRNVLIYFDVETKKGILKKVRENLRTDGYFFLGGAETTLGLDDCFERVSFDKTTCYQIKPGK